jgi:site-specific DNA recombinase
VADIIVDSKSAKKPGRKGFGEMLEKIQKGEAQGILCWKLDRLARNPIDGASISWNLQQGIIQQIITPERCYDPSDNTILMSVEFGMANQYILDLQKNVKRGMKSKIEKGWLPTKAPFGYINEKHAEKGNKRILPDPETFATLKKLWKILLTKKCSLMELYRIMENTLPLVRNGKILGFSSFDRIFHNIFYAGYFTWNREIKKGAHKPMITLSEYEEAQRILGNARDLRKGMLQFDYKGMFRCSICGCSITGEAHTKRIKSTGEEKTFRYYRCTRKKRDIKCTEKPVSESSLEE